MLLDETDRQAFIARSGVSHETMKRLEAYVALLIQWQERINLVSPKTLKEIWTRHILDSTQLVGLAPQARRWVDIGSGGGLPGLVIGCAMAEIAGGKVDLVESNGKKAAFLRHVSATLSLPVQVHAGRIEDVLPTLDTPDVLCARALAPLDDLLRYGNLLLKRGAIGLFPKGRDAEDELTNAGRHWHFKVKRHISVTEPAARILEISMTEIEDPISVG